MLDNEILAEIHRTREAIARESDYDVAKLFAHFRAVTETLAAEGWRIAAPESADVSCVVREEEPPAR